MDICECLYEILLNDDSDSKSEGDDGIVIISMCLDNFMLFNYNFKFPHMTIRTHCRVWL